MRRGERDDVAYLNVSQAEGWREGLNGLRQETAPASPANPPAPCRRLRDGRLLCRADGRGQAAAAAASDPVLLLQLLLSEVLKAPPASPYWILPVKNSQEERAA